MIIDVIIGVAAVLAVGLMIYIKIKEAHGKGGSGCCGGCEGCNGTDCSHCDIADCENRKEQ